MGIWRNIGKIVTLLYQIVYEQMKWTLRSFKRVPTKKSNTPKKEVKNIYLDEELERVEWSENPYYEN